MAKYSFFLLLFIHVISNSMEEKNQTTLISKTLIWKKDFLTLEKEKNDVATVIDISHSTETHIDPALLYYISKNCPKVTTLITPPNIKNFDDLRDYICGNKIAITLTKGKADSDGYSSDDES